MDLEHALEQFDRTQTNLKRLDDVWGRLQSLVPDGIVFPGTSPEELLYDELLRSFDELAAGLPRLDGQDFRARPLELGEIAQARLNAEEVDEPELWVRLGEDMAEPTRAIAEYRQRLTRARKRLVRARALELVANIDELLRRLTAAYPSGGDSVSADPDWQALDGAVRELNRLVAQDVAKTGRWQALYRHLGFAQAGDLHDIAKFDWPSVRPDIEAMLYDELEPLPIAVADLSELAAT